MRRFGYCPRVIRLLYMIAYSLGFVLLSPLFLYKMWKRGKYRENFWQRFGFYSTDLRERLAPKKETRCWIQAVSVGEVNVALLFIGALQRKFPDLRIVVTTTTSTGYALAYERLPQEVDLLYFPQDFPWSVRRAYDLIQPDFIVLMESELWPNHIWMAARRNVPLFLVNGRMSLRSEQRYKRLGGLSSQVFDKLALVCAQSPEDADNFVALGVPRDRVHMTGNMKYDYGTFRPTSDSSSDSGSGSTCFFTLRITSIVPSAKAARIGASSKASVSSLPVSNSVTIM